jgi:uncharacterized protein YbcC (UPF0753/DUF2309 family)/formate hydrogenlyase subunit 3/multisubunit Na+/H+ antiporter MnhD subunit
MMATDWTLWLPALGPLALAAVGVIPAAAANRHPAAMATSAFVASSVALSIAVVALIGHLASGPLRTDTIGAHGIGFAFYLDAPAAIVFVLVAFVGAVVIRYSRHYLDGDANQGRFIKWLCLTLASVLVLIVSGNLLQLALAWIATSLGLHRLLVFYPERPGAVLAARKKFVASRIGDLCLIGAIVLMYRLFGSLDITEITSRAASFRSAASLLGSADAVAALLVTAALLKSAQFPLHGWLLEVMETPTPVSALLHAGIINAGGFLLLRLSDVVVLSALSLDMLIVAGGITAVFGSTVMLTQTSVKVSLAYSTVAQMGFMLLQCGLGAFSAALLHIVAHSLYKAHAFLASGSVIDLTRASWSLDAKGRPHPARLALALGTVLSFALAAVSLFGVTVAKEPSFFVLGAVVVFGFAYLIVNALDVPPEAYVVRRTVLVALGVAAAYFALQWATGALTAGVLPSVQPFRGPIDIAILAAVVLGFAALTVAQIRLPYRAKEPRWQAFYAHVSNGFYVNTVANRLAVRFWPAPAPRPAASHVQSQKVIAVIGDAGGWGDAARVKALPDVPKTPELMATAITAACERIAPLWPLKSFVAVNPFLGFAGQPFSDACATLRRVACVEILMPHEFYREARATGAIMQADLATALAATEGAAPAWARVEALDRALAQGHSDTTRRPRAVVATVADVLDTLAGGDRRASRTAFMVDEISKWCAAYFDQGQAAWKLPSRSLEPYAAWRAAMRHDRNPEAMGIKGFRSAVAAMPDDPRAAIGAVVEALDIPARAVADYLYRALFDIGGWAAYVAYLAWDNRLNGRNDDRLVGLLAIRVVWGYALFCERQDLAFKAAWASAMAAAAARPEDEPPGGDADLVFDLTLQAAYEAAYQRQLLSKLAANFDAGKAAKPARAAVQAAFCIDVRSEIYRRALETVSGDVETIGFAGFFGFPIEYVPIGRLHGGAQCPVLLTPAFTVCEAVAGASATEEADILNLRLLRQRAAKAWKAFKMSAVSSFTYVETAGLLFAAKIIGDSLGWTRPVPHPHLDGLDRSVRERIGPRLAPRIVAGRETGFGSTQRLAMAEAVLRAMSMTDGFARLVLLVGHASSTVNNPHGTSLDCGACGGHTGEANARVAAGILNDPFVRSGLVERGIAIPQDTWFLGALHDTTTDQVRIFNAEEVPAGLAGDLDKLRACLSRASTLARLERSALLKIGKTPKVDAQIMARSRDWSQVRPEWGLAGNAAFIAAPRARTAGLDLGGRVFLHSYDWQQDKDFHVLDLIMTAPMIVASWINLQYYGSTVNNRVFGSGNKTLHNVVGTIGVLEGNGGDLRVGLPWQSVHDGTGFVHKPLRLNVFIEAPQARIDDVIARHQGVRDLVENCWLHLFAIGNDGSIARYAGKRNWRKEERR